MSQRTQHRFQLWGWILFVGSACFYIATSFRSGDMIGLVGGVLFLVACLVFLVPLLMQRETEDDEQDRARALATSNEPRGRVQGEQTGEEDANTRRAHGATRYRSRPDK